MSAEPELLLRKSIKLPKDIPVVKGYDWNQGINYNEMITHMACTGFQATNFRLAVDEINRMLEKRFLPLDEDCQDVYEEDEFIRRRYNCTIFFGYTSSIVSSGLRETVRFLVEHKLVDCIVTSARGFEEDIVKCLASTNERSCDELSRKELKEKGINRIGNLLVPKDCQNFENFVSPILDDMLNEQKREGKIWTPSKMIERIGQRIENEESIYFWAAKNKIPVFCPALTTDGRFGDMIYFHSFRNPGLILDIIDDLRRINLMAMKAVKSGIVSVGAGLIKHHMCKANCIRDGSDYAVYLNTAQEFDGSDSGASPDESVACGKIKVDATPVKIHGEASLVFPLLVGETFAKYVYNEKEFNFK